LRRKWVVPGSRQRRDDYYRERRYTRLIARSGAVEGGLVSSDPATSGIVILARDPRARRQMPSSCGARTWVAERSEVPDQEAARPG
jgi:hypothetical protein